MKKYPHWADDYEGWLKQFQLFDYDLKEDGSNPRGLPTKAAPKEDKR